MSAWGPFLVSLAVSISLLLFSLIPNPSYLILLVSKIRFLLKIPKKMTGNFYLDDNPNSDQGLSSGENRRHVRFPISLTVEYGKQTPVEYNSFILNMSARGCYIQTNEPFPVGSEIIIRLVIPPQIKILVTLTGKVAWVNKGESPLPPGMGIKFNEDNAESLADLNSYLEEEMPLIDRQA
ncbi:MAG: hypothetical protein C0407_07430 [Desulfobacca sp.]|nr:hypothetical protein [Desulfobacca sp.]